MLSPEIHHYELCQKNSRYAHYSDFLTTMFYCFFRLSMECGPSLSSVWPSLRRVPFCQTQVACWQDICRLPRFYTFCSFPMIIPWNISSLTPLEHSWQSSLCFCCYAWSAQVHILKWNTIIWPSLIILTSLLQTEDFGPKNCIPHYDQCVYETLEKRTVSVACP